ncbi:hypothetical protein Tsubulata_008814, partial [Turnera subulata]
VVLEKLLKFNLIEVGEYLGQQPELIFLRDLLFVKFQIVSATITVSTFYVLHQKKRLKSLNWEIPCPFIILINPIAMNWPELMMPTTTLPQEELWTLSGLMEKSRKLFSELLLQFFILVISILEMRTTMH